MEGWGGGGHSLVSWGLVKLSQRSASSAEVQGRVLFRPSMVPFLSQVMIEAGRGGHGRRCDMCLSGPVTGTWECMPRELAGIQLVYFG